MWYKIKQKLNLMHLSIILPQSRHQHSVFSFNISTGWEITVFSRLPRSLIRGLFPVKVSLLGPITTKQLNEGWELPKCGGHNRALNAPSKVERVFQDDFHIFYFVWFDLIFVQQFVKGNSPFFNFQGLSFNKYLLSSHCVPDPVLAARKNRD